MADRARPPLLGTLILSLFSTEPDYPEIEGDLSEEFHDRVKTAGPTASRRWYLWEVFRNVSTLILRQCGRSPIQTLAISIACLLVLNLPPFLVLFEVHHRRLPNLEWSTFVLFSVAYQSLMPPLLGVVGSELLPDRAFALVVTFAGLHVLGGNLRLLDYPLLDPLVSHPAHWQWMWAVVSFSVASLAFQNRRGVSSRTAS